VTVLNQFNNLEQEERLTECLVYDKGLQSTVVFIFMILVGSIEVIDLLFLKHPQKIWLGGYGGRYQ